MKKFLFGLMFSLLATYSYSQTACTNAPTKEIVVFFGNGVNNSVVEMNFSAKSLKDALPSKYGKYSITMDNARNTSNNVISDLIESIKQVGQQDNVTILRYLTGLSSSAPDWFIYRLSRLYEHENTSISAYYDVDLSTQVYQYKKTLEADKIVLVVAHSQGNLFANAAKSTLSNYVTAEAMNRFAIVSVATPASNVGGVYNPTANKNNLYITNSLDFISRISISAAAKILYRLNPLYLDPLTSNLTLTTKNGIKVSNGISMNPLTAHSFVNTYLSDSYNVKPALINIITMQFDKLIKVHSALPLAPCVDFKKYFLAKFVGTYNVYSEWAWFNYKEYIPITVSFDLNGNMYQKIEKGYSLPYTMTPRDFKMVIFNEWNNRGSWDRTWGDRESVKINLHVGASFDTTSTYTFDPLDSRKLNYKFVPSIELYKYYDHLFSSGLDGADLRMRWITRSTQVNNSGLLTYMETDDKLSPYIYATGIEVSYQWPSIKNNQVASNLNLGSDAMQLISEKEGIFTKCTVPGLGYNTPRQTLISPIRYQLLNGNFDISLKSENTREQSTLNSISKFFSGRGVFTYPSGDSEDRSFVRVGINNKGEQFLEFARGVHPYSSAWQTRKNYTLIRYKEKYGITHFTLNYGNGYIFCER